MANSDETSAAAEHENHRYTGNRIPWYVHLIWIAYWCFAIYYVVRYLFPSLQIEFVSPP